MSPVISLADEFAAFFVKQNIKRNFAEQLAALIAGHLAETVVDKFNYLAVIYFEQSFAHTFEQRPQLILALTQFGNRPVVYPARFGAF